MGGHTAPDAREGSPLARTIECQAFAWRVIALIAAIVVSVGHNGVRAADPTFVGVLALAVDDEGARLLGLDDETREKLLQLIAAREDQVQQLVLEIKDLSDQEKQARLAPFVVESERLGRELMTVEQRDRLSQLRLSRAGMVALADDEVGRLLGVTPEQKESLQKLLAARSAEMTRGGEVQRRITHESYERRLRAVLTDQQLGEWERLAGLGAGQVRSRTSATPTVAPRQGSKDPAGPGNQSETPADDRASHDATTTDATDGDPGVEASDRPLRFSFKGGATWREVLEWLAEQADLALHLDDVPEGTLDYTDTRTYTPDQAIDRLNRFLIKSGYILIRSGNLLSVINLEDAKDRPDLIDVLVGYVPLNELDRHGDYEVVKCLFPLVRMEPTAAVTEFSPLCTLTKPIALTNSKQLLITETAGKLRAIRDIIRTVENPQGDRESVKEFVLQHISADDLLKAVRPLLGLEEDAVSNDDISVSTDTLGTRIFAVGKAEKLEIIGNLVQKLDHDPAKGAGPATMQREVPELLGHPVGAANLQMVYDVLQTMLAGRDVRIAKEGSSNAIVVLATQSVHRLVDETIAKLAGEAVDFEIIDLKGIDPQYVVTLINQMFGTVAPKADGNQAAAAATSNSDAPRVDADPVNMRLFVRGKKSQIVAIKGMIEKLGQTNTMNRGRTRLLPYQGADALRALETVKRFWPAENPIQIFAPGADGADSSVREVDLSPPKPRETTPGPDLTPAPDAPELRAPETRRGRRDTDKKAGGREPSPAEVPAGDRTTARPPASSRVVLTGLFDETNVQETNPDTHSSTAVDQNPAPQEPAIQKPAAEKPAAPPIIIQMTPQGILIQSDDLEALNRFEEIFRTIAGPQDGPFGRQLAVFYLKYALAEDANRLLAELLGGKTSTSGSGGGLVSQVTSNVLGGGLLGLMAGGGGSTSSGSTVVSIGSTTIVPDARLNRLIVQGTAADIANVESHLRVIDKEGSITDVETRGIPHIVQLEYTTADEAARLIREAYASRIEGNQQRNQNPQVELFRALANRGNAQQQNQNQEPKMTLAVDARSNSLVITAPEPLFREVAALVRIIDRQGAQPTETYTVKSLKKANGAYVSRVVGNLFAGQVITSGNNSRPGQGPFGGGQGGNRGFGGQGNFGGGQGNFGGGQGNFGGGNMGGGNFGFGFGGGNLGFGGGQGGVGFGGGQGRGGFGGGQGGGQGRGGQGGGQGRGGPGGGGGR